MRLSLWYCEFVIFFPRSSDNSLSSRPSYLGTGTVGRSGALKLRTNYVDVDASRTWIMFIYHVGFEPLVASERLKRALVNRHKSIHKGHFIPDAQLITGQDFGEKVCHFFYSFLFTHFHGEFQFMARLSIITNFFLFSIIYSRTKYRNVLLH